MAHDIDGTGERTVMEQGNDLGQFHRIGAACISTLILATYT